jgi:Uncharacterized protein conserved in bacteria (DUF2213)
MSELRELHLRGATGTVRLATLNDREHLVVPIVALVEGVIHAINAEVPEYVPIETLSAAPQTWNNRPAVLKHPIKNGKQVSANTPHVLEAQGLGSVFNAEVKGRKLHMEAYIDPQKAEKLGAGKMLERLRANEVVEVSVGAYVVTERRAGEHNGKPYKAVWTQIVPDHLAFLPDGIGACNASMGCGTRAAEAYLVTAEGLTTLENRLAKKRGFSARVKSFIEQLRAAAAEDETLTEEESTEEETSPEDAPKEETADQVGYKTMQVLLEQLQGSMGLASSAVTELTGNTTEDDVKIAQLEAIQSMCMTMYGSINAIMSVSSNLLRPDGVEPARYMQGARNSRADQKVIQDVHDHSVTLGAECSDMKAAGEKPCGCMEDAMSKDARTAAIKQIAETDGTGFTKDDVKTLEAMSDKQLEGIKTLVDAKAAAEVKAAEDKKSADDKAAADLKTAAEKPQTVEDYLKSAPVEIRTLVERQQKQDAARKTALLGQLKTAQSEYTEDELKVMDVDQLERLARVAKVETPADYRGRGVARAAEENDVFLNPPDPYALALKAREQKVQ